MTVFLLGTYTHSMHVESLLPVTTVLNVTFRVSMI